MALTYKVLEGLFVCVGSAIIAPFIRRELCILPSCGAFEAIYGMIFAYVFCSVITLYVAVTAIIFAIAFNVRPILFRSLIVAATSALYVGGALFFAFGIDWGLIWLAIICVSLSAFLASAFLDPINRWVGGKT